MATIILAEDHAIVRQGLSTLLRSVPALTVVAEASNGRQALDLVETHRPDVLIVDLAMPEIDGLEVTRLVKRRAPKTRVIILSMHNDEQYVVRALHHGAAAYVLKEASMLELKDAIAAVLQDQRYLSKQLPADLVEQYESRRVKTFQDRYETLTTREREILHLVAEGHRSQTIADKLFISVRTVETHRTNLMAKLGLQTQTDLVRYALQRGLIPLRPGLHDEDDPPPP